MRAILLFLLVLGLAALSGVAAVTLADRIAQDEPSVRVGLAVPQPDGGAIVPVRLEPVAGGTDNDYIVRTGDPLLADAITTPAGVTLTPQGQDQSGRTNRFKVAVASRAAARAPVGLSIIVPSPETQVSVWPEHTVFSMLRDDFGIEEYYDWTVGALIAGAGAALGLLIFWLIAVIWMGADSVRRKRAQATADRLAERTTDLERERDKLRQQSQSDASADAREAAFWRDAVIGFLTNRNVEQSEIDRLLASIQVAIREKESPVDIEPERDETMPSLVAKRDWD